MNDKEKEILKKIGESLPGMPENKKERFLGIAEGMALMKERQQKNKSEKKVG